MLIDQIADVLKGARKALGLTQRELARRTGVSPRLWAEVERGARPDVSLETALRMLGAAGVTIRLTDPRGTSRELRDPRTAAAARAARAAVRRATWTGRQIRLDQEGEDDPTAACGAARLAAVARVSAHAFTVARAPTSDTRRSTARPAALSSTRSPTESPTRPSARARR